jgi:hypothetical protein
VERRKRLQARTRLTRTTRLQPGQAGLTSRTPLDRTGSVRPRSPRRAEQMALYVPLAKAFLEQNQWCWFPGCTRRSSEVHHRRGRSGERLLDQRWWAASCHAHNELAETNTGYALSVGWLIEIESAPGTRQVPRTSTRGTRSDRTEGDP